MKVKIKKSRLDRIATVFKKTYQHDDEYSHGFINGVKEALYVLHGWEIGSEDLEGNEVFILDKKGDVIWEE